MFQRQTIKDIDLKDKIVLVRADYNVPLENGEVASDFRVRASLPTLEYLLAHDTKKIIIISHLGRPKGKKNQGLSLEPVAESLKNLLPNNKIKFIDKVFGSDVKTAAEKLQKGEILLLENLRFSPGEEENSEDFIKEIITSTGAEIFVQDGFAVIHRKHASTSAVAKFLPVYAGLLLEKEISMLSKVKENPEKPLLVVIGGSKVEDKKPLIEKFSQKADKIAIGGEIAADGYKANSEKIYVAEDFDEDSEGRKLDVGPLSAGKIAEFVKKSKTVVWNGVLGKVEDETYATSSTILAKILGETPEIFSVICGGDTSGFVENLAQDFPELNFSLVSTGGGASLEFLLDKPLPGLEVIKKSN